MANQKMSPIEMERYLRGASYPASKEQLMQLARQNGAPEPVTKMIQQLPTAQFNRATDVTQALGAVK